MELGNDLNKQIRQSKSRDFYNIVRSF